IGEDSQGSWTLTICDNDPTQHDGAYNQSRLLIRPQDTAVRAGNWFYRGTAVAGDYVEQTLSIYGTDLVGNQTQPLTFTFAVDTAAPVITVTTQPTAAVAMGDPFRLAGLVSDGGQVQVMRLNIIAPDGSVLADTIDHTNGMWVYTDTSQFVQGGAYTLFVEAEDEAGNQSVAGPFVLTIVALEPTRIYLPLILQY
ncbi:MAG: hypothetical protein ACE5FD_14980, partial [Anaerolineae bacterium]